MNKSLKENSFKLNFAIYCVAFCLYNALLFVICGFRDHGAGYWISYAFMILAFAIVAVCIVMMRRKINQPCDAFFNIPVLIHCVIYLIIQCIASVTFVILDYFDVWWVIAFSIQIVISAIFFVFIISCIAQRELITEIRANIKEKTTFIAELCVEADMISKRSEDHSVKVAFSDLAEQLRYSDPMSESTLKDIEEEILSLIIKAKVSEDVEEKICLCKRASLLLEERNKKCKIHH